MSKFAKLITPLLTALALSAASPTQGEIATAESLLSFRTTRNIVWLDPLNNEPLHRRGQKDNFVVAAKDDDIHANLDNAGTIMGGYLANAQSIPVVTARPALLIALIKDTNWNRLFILAEKYRKSINNIMRDCFGREIYRLKPGVADAVGNTRDIIDIPTLLNVVSPVIVAGSAIDHAERPVVTAGETATAEALLTFRRGKNFLWLDPRTGQSLYRVTNDNPLQAAKDDDIHANLDNAGTIMGGYLSDLRSIPAATARPDALTAIFNDANLTRLYTLVEDARRGQNRFMLDCLGNPLYKLTLGARVQAVDMREIVDIPTLLTAVETYFPQNCRSVQQQVVNTGSCEVKPSNAISSPSILEDVLEEVSDKKDKK